MATEQTAIAKVDPIVLEQLAQMVLNSGESSTYNTQLATGFIKWAAQNTNLISPAMACPNLPLGFELAFTRVDINPDPKFKEVYKLSDGGLALTKVGLEKIQKGAGIRLDPKLSRKLDNGEDPLFAVYEFVGHYRDFDGTICPLKGTKELDLHDDSAELKKIRSRQKSQTSGDNEINELRRFIGPHAESKARNRGIRSFGVKPSYTHEELEKPFTCIRLIRTGRCDDPATQLMLTKMIHEEYQQAEQALFGSSRPQLTVGKDAGSTAPGFEETAFPSQQETKSDAPNTSVNTATGGAAEQSTSTAAPETQRTETAITQTKAEPYVLKSGKHAGKLVEALPDSSLSMLTGYYDHLATLSVKDESQTADIGADRAALLAEVASRKAEESQVAQDESQGELKL